MAKYSTAVRMNELRKDIPYAEERLAHLINRRMEIEGRDVPNKEYKRKLLAKYRLEIKSMTDLINNLNTELWGLQELSYK